MERGQQKRQTDIPAMKSGSLRRFAISSLPAGRSDSFSSLLLQFVFSCILVLLIKNISQKSDFIRLQTMTFKFFPLSNMLQGFFECIGFPLVSPAKGRKIRRCGSDSKYMTGNACNRTGIKTGLDSRPGVITQQDSKFLTRFDKVFFQRIPIPDHSPTVFQI